MNTIMPLGFEVIMSDFNAHELGNSIIHVGDIVYAGIESEIEIQIV